MDGLASAVVSATVDAVVVRANGAREPLGTVAYWHRSLTRRLIHALGRPGGGRRRAGVGALADLLADRTGATVLTHAGKAIVTDRIKGAGGAEPSRVGWGTGAGTAAAGDTGLFAEKDVDLAASSGTRTSGTSSRVTTAQTNDTYQVVGTRTATGAGTVTNAGLFDSATIGAGAMLMKADFAGIGLAAGDGIEFTFKLQMS